MTGTRVGTAGMIDRGERLAGKVALITGGASGQGAAEARLFAAQSARVVIADIADDAGAALAEEIGVGGGVATYRHLDVADEQNWADVIAAVDAAYGRIDVLVNNAGVGDQRGVMAMGLSGWDRVIDINLWGPVVGMRTVQPVMERGGGGSIVNISSVAGLTGYDAAAYTASKWALRGVTKVAALEFAASGVRVNSVHPGTIDTPMIAHVSAAGVAGYVQNTPLRRSGTPEEIAGAVLYLASDEASFVTGAELAVDGGFVAGGANLSLELRVKQLMGAVHE